MLELLVQGMAWGSTKLELTAGQMDDLDFALARGGVSAAVGLRHLLNSTTSVGLLPVTGLTIGWHPYDKALMMASAYRAAMAELKTQDQQELIAALVVWLDGFVPWSEVAERLGRPRPGPDRLLRGLRERARAGHAMTSTRSPPSTCCDRAEGEPLRRCRRPAR